MDLKKLSSLVKIGSEHFLVKYQFPAELRSLITSDAVEFRCREIIDHLVDFILSLHLVSADFYQGVYSFCPE